MSKETNGIATRGDCNSIVSVAFTTDLLKCPTKSEILATGKLNVSGSYADNQLVKYDDIESAYNDHNVIVSWTDVYNQESDTYTYGIQFNNYYPCPLQINISINISNGTDEYVEEATFAPNETGSKLSETPDDTYGYWTLLSQSAYIVGNDRWIVVVNDPQ